jgi:hypothetical protein
VLDRSVDTVHLRFDGIDVSIFVLDRLGPFVEGQRLSVTGLLATKLDALLDRGTRRDFFDLFVTLQANAVGTAECLSAMRQVFRQELNEGLLLRALTWFDDADREAALPGEGADDWATVKEFFRTRGGHLLVPPSRTLRIQRQIVDVADGPGRPRRRKRAAPRRDRG